MRWQRKWRVRGRDQEQGRGVVVVVVRASERREQASMGGRAAGRECGAQKGTDSVPTLLITVSLETERGLPLALGNLLGPVAERVQRWREGKGQRGGRKGRVELNGLYDTGTLLYSILFSGFTSVHSHQR